eukprot:20690-Heterococcus_DN1.PRE.2
MFFASTPRHACRHCKTFPLGYGSWSFSALFALCTSTAAMPPRKRAVKAKEAEPVVEQAADSEEDEENEDTVADLKAAVPSEIAAFRKLFADAQVLPNAHKSFEFLRNSSSNYIWCYASFSMCVAMRCAVQRSDRVGAVAKMTPKCARNSGTSVIAIALKVT